ncbi:ABC transporter ATP-binding protein [Desnuesiella massiliensis]|uniref:ABC transporter ATP-binding protein n=1 Tax=Desnuesiella massiliensis TaxID=1650662 RepID=UPI0006E407B0|nr:ABC transporter ATP-binding protein [Desnuesiella massiliensis]
MNKLKALFKYALKYKRQYLIGILVLIIIDALHLVPPKILGRITDSFSTGQAEKSFILKNIALFIIVAILTAVGRFVWRILIVGTSKHIEYDLRNSFFGHLQKLSVNFYNKNKTGDLMALATNDLNAVIMALGFGVVMIIDSLFLSAITIITMLTINVKLALISLIPLPFISLTASKFGKRIHKRFLKVQKSFSELTDVVQENLSGIRIIKSFVQEEEEFKKFTKQNQNNFNTNMKFSKLWGLMNPLVEFISSLGFVIFIALGGFYVIYGEITLGDFVAFNMYLGQLIWPMMAIGWVINVIQRGFASLERLEAVLQEKPEIYDNATHNIPSINGVVEIRDLTFTYPGTEIAALNHINIRVEKGHTLGIVGRTGSGKTTLINLLVKLFAVEEGKIIINGIDINKIPLKTLRENIGLVSDPFLFSSTIAENINLAKDSLNMDEVHKAAINSDIYDNIIDFPKKFETLVGERGVTLSGGQKQRVSIARALIKDPEILILDDCLSAVDAKTEVRILDNLKSIMKDKTSIIISHRISAVKDSDNIIVLDEGKIIEEGTHEELLYNKGLYFSIYEKQLIEQKIQEEGEV